MLFVRLPRFRPLSLLATGQSRGPKVQSPVSSVQNPNQNQIQSCSFAFWLLQLANIKVGNGPMNWQTKDGLHSGTLTRKGNACSIFGHLHSCLYMLTPDGLKIRNVYRRQETMTPRVDHSFGITAKNKEGSARYYRHNTRVYLFYSLGLSCWRDINKKPMLLNCT